MIRRWPLALVLLSTVINLSGCWDLRELNQLALVMAVGVDRAPEAGRYLVTIQVARPGGKEGGRQESAGGMQPVYTASADGDTLFAAIRNLAQFTSRRLTWAHNNVVVIGESVASEDITPVVDFFTRNPELRLRTWVVVARDATAREIVAAKTGLENVPADSISALFRYARLPGESVRTDMNDLASAFFSTELQPVVSVLRLRAAAVPISQTGSEHASSLQVELRGTAILRRSKLVGYVDADAGRGLVWLRNEMKNAVTSIPCPDDPGRNMAVEIRSPEVELRTDASGHTPVVNVQVNTAGWLVEQDCQTPTMDTPDLKTYAEQEFARKITGDIRTTLGILQRDLRVDAVKFARLFHYQQPAWWRQHESEWEEIFPRVQVNLRVQARIPKMGTYKRPMNRGNPAP